jgi:hypothetical protein
MVNAYTFRISFCISSCIYYFGNETDLKSSEERSIYIYFLSLQT